MTLNVLTYDMLLAGRDGADDRRAQTQIELTRALAARAIGYEVIRTPATDMASDHYPVLAQFEVSR